MNEPLELSAPLAWRIAKIHCNMDAVTGESCAWNHGLWQFLRIMGIAGTAAHRSEFYQSRIKAYTEKNPAPRILISGATDYAMLAQVIAVFAGMDITPSITVVDVCETPLRLNNWYAERANYHITTARASILDYQAEMDFDLICTDSFLVRFPHAQWPQLAACWHALLKPGGKVLTATRLRPKPVPEHLTYQPHQIRLLQNRVLEQARQLALPPDIRPEDIAKLAEAFGRNQSNYPLPSPEHLRLQLEFAGFDVNLTVGRCPTEERERTWAPIAPTGAAHQYLYVVAKRL